MCTYGLDPESGGIARNIGQRDLLHIHDSNGGGIGPRGLGTLNRFLLGIKPATVLERYDTIHLPRYLSDGGAHGIGDLTMGGSHDLGGAFGRFAHEKAFAAQTQRDHVRHPQIGADLTDPRFYRGRARESFL